MNLKIPVNDYRDKLKSIGNKITSFNAVKSGEEDIPMQLAEMKREIEEKKLLEYQLKTKKGDVNEFLKAKYSDGNFNEGKLNGYDNSEQRLKNAITFDYHVFFNKAQNADGTDMYEEFRPPKQWLLSKPLVDANGDTFIYHIPLRQNINDDGVAQYLTDYGEAINMQGRSSSRDGIVFALEELNKQQQHGTNQFTNQVIKILRSHGFLNKENKMRYDVRGKIVEKYLKNIKPEKYKEALSYLNEEFDKESVNRKEEEDKIIETIDPQIDVVNNANEMKEKLKKIKDDTKFEVNGLFGIETTIEELITKLEDRYKEDDGKIDGAKYSETEKLIEDYKEYVKDLKKELSDKVKELKDARDKVHKEVLEANGLKDVDVDVKYDVSEDEFKEYLAEEIDKIKEERVKKAAEKKAKEEADKKADEEKKAAKKKEEDDKKVVSDKKEKDKEMNEELEKKLSIMRDSMRTYEYVGNSNVQVPKKINALFNALFGNKSQTTLASFNASLSKGTVGDNIKYLLDRIDEDTANPNTLLLLKKLNDPNTTYTDILTFPDNNFDINYEEEEDGEVMEEVKEEEDGVVKEEEIEIKEDKTGFTVGGELLRFAAENKTSAEVNGETKFTDSKNYPKLILDINDVKNGKFTITYMKIRSWDPEESETESKAKQKIDELNRNKLLGWKKGEKVKLPSTMKRYFVKKEVKKRK